MYSREKGYDLFEDDNDDSLSDTNGSSSEDEIDIILHGTPQQRKRLQQSQRKNKNFPFPQQGQKKISKSSSEDEFEKEMNAELTKHVKMLEDSREKESLKSNNPSTSSNPEAKSITEKDSQNLQPEYYDGIYFDSDEEDAENKHAVVSNDDLLYDPNMDDEDQKWVDRQRNHGHSQGAKGRKAQNSDALLDCPACMTTLCFDCQRHEIYKNQYRAMFVMNCVTDLSESLQCPEQAMKKRKRKGPPLADSEIPSRSNPSDLFHPVKCTECNTVVGVIDKDEVYHFFNVLASHT